MVNNHLKFVDVVAVHGIPHGETFDLIGCWSQQLHTWQNCLLSLSGVAAFNVHVIAVWKQNLTKLVGVRQFSQDNKS